ncbi:MAG: hypothetical protein GKR89_24280 [Candidatus Latescibacteria bacterium]|nr:hypothetical protein [Candidatus Latescibacterota bacterium]
MRTIPVALAILALCGAALAAETTDTHRVKAGKAKSAVLRLSCPVGQFNIQGGGKVLFDGAFHYTRPEWKPELEYRVDNDKGRLTIDVPEGSKDLSDPDRNQWDLVLGDDIPLDIKLEFGAGEGQFDMTGLDLTRLEVDMGAGDIVLDLADTSIPSLDIEAGVGRAQIDLSGSWDNDLDAEFKCGIGELVLILPPDVGARIEVNGGLGHVSAHGFNEHNGTYTNGAYNGKGPTLDISIVGGLGSIRLQEAKD